MNAGRRTCPDDNQLDAYVLGTLSGNRLAAFEEHLLVCASCQDRLTCTVEFVRAVRRVAPRLRERRAPKTGPTPRVAEWFERWVFAMANAITLRPLALTLVAAAALLIAGPWLRQQRTSGLAGGPVRVDLESFRGVAGSSRAPASRPLVFRLRAEDLPPSPAYWLEMVTAGGERRWKVGLTPAGNRLQAGVDPQQRGHYFLRLLTPSGTLLREYSLEIVPASTP